MDLPSGVVKCVATFYFLPLDSHSTIPSYAHGMHSSRPRTLSIFLCPLGPLTTALETVSQRLSLFFPPRFAPNPRSLADARYDRRKAAALEIETLTRKLLLGGHRDRITGVIQRLCTEFALSPDSNHRKGGLIGLAALTVGLGPSGCGESLALVLPPVLSSFIDQDARVRYSAAESMYNILKISRTKFLPFFLAVFDGLTRLVADPDPNVQAGGHRISTMSTRIRIPAHSAAHEGV